jgi:hypothetical protein
LLVSCTFAAILSGGAFSPPVSAEPAFAVRTGYACSTCHVNRTGGGLRTSFGSIYAQTVLPRRLLQFRQENNLLAANPDARFNIGGDFRGRYVTVASDDSADVSSFEVPEANLYAQVRLIPTKLSLYVDEKLGPSGASSREFFGMYAFGLGDGYVKIGKFLPAFGWRLPDDAAFIRQFSGFAYSNPDTGVEVGFEPGKWSIHVAATNGAGGAGDDNRSKQVSMLTVRRIGKGRIGVSASNNLPQGARVTQTGILGGFHSGRLSLLAEADWRETKAPAGVSQRLIGYFEADILISRGFNLKLSHDWLDPDLDIDTDAQTRTSIGIELIPIPFLQLRYFVRFGDGPPQTLGARDNSVEIEAHFFF